MTDNDDKTRDPAASPDLLDDADGERRAEREGRDVEGREGRDVEGRPLHGEETAPGERGDGPYGDSEPPVRGDRPGT
jgi:hypothetical protein